MTEVVVVGSRLGDVGVGSTEVVAVRLVGGDEGRVGIGAVEVVEDLMVVADGQDGCDGVRKEVSPAGEGLSSRKADSRNFSARACTSGEAKIWR